MNIFSITIWANSTEFNCGKEKQSKNKKQTEDKDRSNKYGIQIQIFLNIWGLFGIYVFQSKSVTFSPT